MTSSTTPAAAERPVPMAAPVAPRPAAPLTDFCAAFPRLDAAQQERFRLAVTRLLAGHVLMPGTAFKPDADWQFVARFGDLVESYLRLAGWHLEIDRRLGVARVVHEGGQQRVRLGKLESLVLRMLRLVYHEQKLVLRDDDRCQITVGELRERLIHAGLSSLEVSRRKLLLALRALDRYHLIDVERGFEGDDEELIVVSPVVEKVLSPERIEAELRSVDAHREALHARRSDATIGATVEDEDAEDDEDDQDADATRSGRGADGDDEEDA